MKRRLRILLTTFVGGALLSVAAGCTPEDLAAIKQFTGQDLGSAEQVSAGCEQTFGPGGADAGGPCWQIGAAMIQEAQQASNQQQSESTQAHVTNQSRWDTIAYCESGGKWYHVPVTNKFGTFSGGLMIMNSVWRQYDGQQFAPLAYQASRAEQITVAERIWADVGSRAWQCKA